MEIDQNREVEGRGAREWEGTIVLLIYSADEGNGEWVRDGI